ncbi:hypothetical protein [Nostoc sp. JL33]|uniref:hypothetical protein n=1 Tax=Nostoc sp. JL33 TaxID=2815396 RepID=UPI0025F09D69|nr:hypothetical protein [Nostoc sp. JL33]MBN3869042.1 hypothetical protein [Nostoc sp. JL33]
MLNKSFSIFKIAFAIIPVSIMLGSCGNNNDLKMAENFGLQAAKLETANDKVSADIYDSCARRASWFADRKNMQEQLKVCDQLYRPNSERANTAGSVLVGYVRSVGELAAQDTAAFNEKYTAIANALKNLEVKTNTGTAKIDDNTINAGLQIANFLTNLSLRDFQRSNLKAAVICTDEYIQPYANGLASFFDENYVNDLLDREIEKISEHYAFYGGRLNNVVNSSYKNSGEPEAFASLQDQQMELEQKERTEIDKVISKKKDGAAYVTTIRKTAEFHAKLKLIFNNNKEQLSPQQKSECGKYFAKETESINAQTSAFLNQKINPSELAQVRKVTKEYISQVSPLLAKFDEKPKKSTNK